MPTFTSRLDLIKPDEGETVDVNQLNANFDALDSDAGATQCTSTTRPTGSDLYPGLLIYETDTGNTLVYTGVVGSLWVPVAGRGGAQNVFSPLSTTGTFSDANISWQKIPAVTYDRLLITMANSTIDVTGGGRVQSRLDFAYAASTPPAIPVATANLVGDVSYQLAIQVLPNPSTSLNRLSFSLGGIAVIPANKAATVRCRVVRDSGTPTFQCIEVPGTDLQTTAIPISGTLVTGWQGSDA